MAREAQGALAELQASSAVSDAADKLGVSASDLARRTEFGASSDSLLLSVRVSAPTAVEAADAANAVAEAAVAATQRRLSEEIAGLSASTLTLIREGRLPDSIGEQARVNQLGQGLAASQVELLSKSRQLTLLQRADASAVSTPSKPLMALLGFVGGAFLGATATAIVGARRGRVHSEGEVQRLFPDAEVVKAVEVPAYLATAFPRVATLVVATTRPLHHGQRAVRELRDILEAAGYRVHMPSSDGLPTAHPATSTRGSEAAGEVHQVTLVSVSSGSSLLSRYAQDSHALVVHPVFVNESRVEELDRSVGALVDRPLLTMMGPVERTREDAAAPAYVA